MSDYLVGTNCAVCGKKIVAVCRKEIVNVSNLVFCEECKNRLKKILYPESLNLRMEEWNENER